MEKRWTVAKPYHEGQQKSAMMAARRSDP